MHREAHSEDSGRHRNPTLARGIGPEKPALSARALVVGLALAFTVGALGPYLELYVQGSQATRYFTSQVTHALFFVLVGLVNVVLGAIRRPWAFRAGELLVIFILMTLANAIQILIYYWIALVAAPFYYGVLESKWADVINPHIPEWVVPGDADVARAFFEGSGVESTGTPWSAWLGPIACWLPVVVALHVAMLCLMIILRRRWADQERLIYPLVQLPLAMVQDDDRGSLLKPFFRSRVMWLGFALPMFVGGVIGLHSYFPAVPTIRLSISFPFFSCFLSFATLGFFFLIKREVAFGLWVFTLLNNLQAEIYGRVGWGTEREPAISVWSYGHASLVHQGMGAMIVLVMGGLWVGREHLQQVFRKAFAPAPDVDDGAEILSYRGAVWGLLGSGMVMFAWLWALGIPPLGTLVLLFFLFIIFVALTRVIAEGGVAVIYAPLVASDASISAIGTSAFGVSGLVGLAFIRPLGNDLLNFVMPHCANGLKLSEQIEGRRRLLFWGMILAILFGLAGAVWMSLRLASTYGANNLWPALFVSLPAIVSDYTAARITTPSGPSWVGWFHTGIGAAVMGLLMLARRHWIGWPLHPLGFPISSTFHWMAFNAFLAWLIKGSVLRYGGVRLYRQVRPLFLGISGAVHNQRYLLGGRRLYRDGRQPSAAVAPPHRKLSKVTLLSLHRRRQDGYHAQSSNRRTRHPRNQAGQLKHTGLRYHLSGVQSKYESIDDLASIRGPNRGRAIRWRRSRQKSGSCRT